MKKLFLLLLLGLITVAGYSQYKKGKKIIDTHEWIDYSLDYVKIKVYEEGMCRISRSQMLAAGLTGIKGAEIKLVRFGHEIPIYTSTNGNFGAADYIEFAADRHDGYLDEYLYMDSTMIPNPNHSLFTDTAVYYLTLESGVAHQRVNVASSSLPVALPTMDYAYHLEELYTNGTVTEFPKVTNPDLDDYTSSGNYYKAFTTNLFFFSNKSNQNAVKSKTFSASNRKTGVPFYSNFTYNPVFNNTYTSQHSLRFSLNNSPLLDTTFQIPYSSDYYPSYLYKFDVEGTSSIVANGNNTVRFSLSAAATFTSTKHKMEYSIPYVDLYIPYETDGFTDNVSIFYSAPNGIAETLRFDGLAANSNYVVYNTTNNTYTEVSTDASGSLMYAVDASSTLDKYLLYKKGSPNVTPVLGTARKFNNILTNRDVNYTMITHHSYIIDPGAKSILDDYATYRESAMGGSYHAQVVDIDDIYENFGYGLKDHPYALKAYLNYIHKNNYVGDSLHCFIICKGAPPRDVMAYDYTTTSPGYPVIACYADPGSDGLFGDFNFDAIRDIAIGRVPVKNATDIEVYFNKVKEYEEAGTPKTNMTVDDFIQTKNVMHLVGIGSGEPQTQNSVKSQLNVAASKFVKPSYIGNVRTFVKQSSQSIEQLDDLLEDTLLNIQGQNIIGFYGHASTSNFDFNLSTPDNMLNKGKYFHMFAFGCTAGNQFILGNGSTISERYNLQADAASVTFSGTTSNGWTNVLGDLYITMAEHVSDKSYGQTIGTITRNFLFDYVDPRLSWIFSRTHSEQWTLNGDPAIRISRAEQPDLVVESKYISTNPSVIDGSIKNITANVTIYNIGKGIQDSIDVQIKKVMQNGLEDSILTKKFFMDKLNLVVPFDFTVDAQNELGVSRIVVTVDPDNNFPEISELNNEAEISYKILSADVIPAYPYDYSIVNYDSLRLFAYTIDPLSENLMYYMELDTTQLFNSPSLIQNSIISKGGVIAWEPNLNMEDSTVYYWRIRPDTSAANGEYRWKGASFVYLPNSSKGWNQSHYYQYLNNDFDDLTLDSTRVFNFGLQSEKIACNIANLYGIGKNYKWSDLFINIGTDYEYFFGCRPLTNLAFVVIDSMTGKPWINNRESSDALDGGSFQSLRPCNYYNQPVFEFLVSTPVERKQAMDFIDSIPGGHYIMVYNAMSLKNQFGYVRNTTYIDDIKADTAIYGSNNSLYHKLLSLGFDQIDSFYKTRPFALFTQKGIAGFPTQQVFGADSTEIITPEFEYNFAKNEGSMTSIPIGPSFEWQEEHWRGTDLESPDFSDSVNISISGMDTMDMVTLFNEWLPGDTSIEHIDHVVYPFAKLKMDLKDITYRTPNQNRYWRINYQEASDLAIAPNISFVKRDTLYQGEDQIVKVAVQNISTTDVKDSFDVVLTLKDKNNATTVLSNTYPGLDAQDSLVAEFDINTNAISGLNSFNIIVNPDARVLESTYLNNSLFSSFYIGSDNLNPILDVTFDNVHIIDNDLVSAKPDILIEVADDNKYLPLNDTSLFEMSLSSYFQGNKDDLGYSFSSSEVNFIPASAEDNKALIEFKPDLADGTYVLDFNAKDQTGNASRINYSVKFRVINQSSITHVLNYPNPFTTQTRFVFTLTGSEIPDDMLIQVFSVSGKLVKEIRQNELGFIHVGTNITEYAWDGRDSHGDPVGNGVYFYRVKAKLDNQDIVHREERIDKAFVEGIGKMYIVR